MRVSSALALAVLPGVVACASNPAPSRWLGGATKETADPYGAWITLETATKRHAQGEFLAVDKDSVFVLGAEGTVRAFAVADVSNALIAYYDAKWGELAAWVAAGSVSTISNGGFLVFTLPLWLIGGSAVTGAQSHAPILNVHSLDQWRMLNIYARFPQGLPSGLPRTLPPKPR
jgi:hypothetical protein